MYPSQTIVGVPPHFPDPKFFRPINIWEHVFTKKACVALFNTNYVIAIMITSFNNSILLIRSSKNRETHLFSLLPYASPKVFLVTV